jgi:hypothetical protein
MMEPLNLSGRRAFEVLETEELPPPEGAGAVELQAALGTIEAATDAAEKKIAAQQAQAARVTLMMISALSNRAVVALSSLFTAGALLSAWVLWRSILPDPSPVQLAGLGGYALFVLAIEYIRRR